MNHPISNQVAVSTKSSRSKRRSIRRGRTLSMFVAACLATGVTSALPAQTLAPSVRTATLDPTMPRATAPGASSPVTTSFSDRSYMLPPVALASSTLSDESLQLGPSSEGTIISIHGDGEHYVSQQPETIYEPIPMPQPGTPHSGTTYLPADGTNYGYTGGGAYSGYGSYGSPVSNPCCPENCHDFYIGYEALFFRRNSDERFTLSQGRYLDRFSYDEAHRITIGQMLDCTDAVEAVYTGPLSWARGRVDQPPGGGLQSVLTTANGYIPAQISTFNNSARHIQVEKADLQSLELNRRWFAWDVMSTFIGFRGFQYNESLQFDTAGAAPDFFAGFHRTRLENVLLGGQIGAEIMRPLGQRLYLGTGTKIGLFANFNQGETILANAGSTLLNAQDRDVDFAGLIQYNVRARYRITRCATVVGGYEGWILAGIATVSDQTYSPVTPLSGTSYEADDLVLFHGATGGIEITF